jgi:hypothetical protein
MGACAPRYRWAKNSGLSKWQCQVVKITGGPEAMSLFTSGAATKSLGQVKR